MDTWLGFRLPTSVAVGPDGTVYVAELMSRVSIVDGDGKLLARWGGDSSQKAGQFVAPHGIAIDSHGTCRLILQYGHQSADRWNIRIAPFGPRTESSVKT